MIVLFIFIIFRKLNQAVSTIIFGRTKAFIFFILWLGDCLVLDPEDVRDANYTISESPNNNWNFFSLEALLLSLLFLATSLFALVSLKVFVGCGKYPDVSVWKAWRNISKNHAMDSHPL
jgi:hypothetical protein